MTCADFKKQFTQQEAIPDDAIAAAVAVLRSGRLHRYNTVANEQGETAAWEAEYATYQDCAYCLAVTSGGTAMQIALRATGVTPGTKVLTNAFTLAPVPGAIAAVGGVPIFVDTTDNLTIDLDDLESKLAATQSKILMLSHMRGHLTDMDALCGLLKRRGATLIEDCAHTMGATWNSTKSGNFGSIACFSTQTYKHLNSGEGGLLTTNDADLMARATILSGSYMLYGQHAARPNTAAFEDARFQMPNCSSRMDNLRAAILRPQLKQLDARIARWNKRYSILETRLSIVDGIHVPGRYAKESHVGSSFQFLVPDWPRETCLSFIDACAARGVELKWFGDSNPVGFTSRYDSWAYAPEQTLPKTLAVLNRTMDLRIPLSFSEEDCALIAELIEDEFSALCGRIRHGALSTRK